MTNSEFRQIAGHFIRHLAPKGSSKGIEFDIKSNNENYTVRSFAIEKDHEIWLKVPYKRFQEFASKDYNKSRIYRDWTRDWIQHIPSQSWSIGINLHPYIPGSVDVLEMRHGKLPIQCDYKWQLNRDNLFLPITERVFKFSDDCYDLYYKMLTEIYNSGDRMWMSFGRNKRRKQIDIINSASLRLTPPSYSKDKPQFADFTFDGFVSLLKEPDWKLMNVWKRQKRMY
jgi:hypothetical protein